jgi:hypothetical protein
MSADDLALAPLLNYPHPLQSVRRTPPLKFLPGKKSQVLRPRRPKKSRITDDHSPPPHLRAPPATVPRPTATRNTQLPAGRFSNSAHMPKHSENRKTCYLCRFNHRGEGISKSLPLTRWGCSDCKVPLCLITSATASQICMTRRHDEVLGGVGATLSGWQILGVGRLVERRDTTRVFSPRNPTKTILRAHTSFLSM